MEYIDISNKLDEFKIHLDFNKRIIFSARFGDGKTFFLKKYFEKYQDRHFCITLHPINYSVARNEDVFEYIKRDILHQLFEEGNIKKIKYKQVFEVIKDNLKERALPLIGDLVSSMPYGKILESLLNISIQIRNDFNAQRKDVVDFLDAFTFQKGGIYERDAYTEVIQSSLKNLRNPKNHQLLNTILIIEDLDRLDPAHLFRILNVLGAHIDQNNDNKFGFDHIVLVMDYDVTRSIFHHFYGQDANYEGYMAKFIDSNPFFYSITEQARKLLKNFLLNKGVTEHFFDSCLVDNPNDNKCKSLKQMIYSLSVRDIQRVLNGMDSLIKHNVLTHNNKNYNAKSPVAFVLAAITLMNMDINHEKFIEVLGENMENLTMLDNYLLFVENSQQSVFTIKNNSFQIDEKEKDGVFELSFLTRIDLAKGISLYELIDSALKETYKNVLDCKMRIR